MHAGLFIAGGSVTAVCFVISLLAEERLRHRLFVQAANHGAVPAGRHTARVVAAALSWTAIITGCIGAVCLILLTCFSNKKFP